MTFWQHFIRLLLRRPAPALAALYWHLTKRRVRARNRLRVASADLAFAYDVWMEKSERIEELADHFRTTIAEWHRHPRFTVVPYATRPFTKEQLTRSMKSLDRQVYRDFSVSGAPSDSLLARFKSAEGDYVVPLRVGDALSPAALFRFAERLQSDRDASILYADEDRIDARGRRSRPWFKPRWNEELFLAQDYLSTAAAIEVRLARSVRAGADDLDSLFVSAVAAATGSIAHVPHIICHAGVAGDEPSAGRMGAIQRHLQGLGATCAAGPFGTVRVTWPLPAQLPLVSIVIPTRDKLDLLRPCLDGVLGKTDYPNFEVIVLNNESVEQRTVDYLEAISNDPRVRVIQISGTYNFSSFNNFAARQARGEYLCLLNNDTEVLEPVWLTEMMRYAVRDDVGAVGAKLLYDDGTIQHAGVVIGIGEAAGHAHRFQPACDPGYFRIAHTAHFVSAVTAACLVVKKEKFDAVGGLDERLAVAFNDVDFCLKLEAAGWRNVYVPHAVLIHHESKSRGKDVAPQNIERYLKELRILQERWQTKTYQDPMHNPNLDRYSETFVLSL